jgi:hypothetical protein
MLFAAALGFLVPPEPSDEGQTYSVVPTLVIGGVLFCASLGLTLYRKGDSVFFLALTLLFYLALVWVVHERVWSFYRRPDSALQATRETDTAEGVQKRVE